MSTLTAQTYLTPEEYLAWERKQPFKNEYHNGQNAIRRNLHDNPTETPRRSYHSGRLGQ